MTFTELRALLHTTTPTDWTGAEGAPGEDGELAVLESDPTVSLRLRSLSDADGFGEAWAAAHPDGNASRAIVELRLNGVCLWVENLVAVDGYRAHIPYPHLIEPEDAPPFRWGFDEETYAVGYLVDSVLSAGRFGEYVKRSGIAVEHLGIEGREFATYRGVPGN